MGINRPHIPYRNSLMSMVLRDSLGGNCYTAMIATVNLSADQLDETISTCRFAQRVAMISNKVSVNEEQDPTLIIRRLKQENRDLKDEIRMLQVCSNTFALNRQHHVGTSCACYTAWLFSSYIRCNQ